MLVSVEDLLGRPGVVYCPTDIEKGLPLDETTLELKDFLKHFKTLEYYMNLDQKMDPNLNSKELLIRCKFWLARLTLKIPQLRRRGRTLKNWTPILGWTCSDPRPFRRWMIARSAGF